jgi:hypothetical protein
MRTPPTKLKIWAKSCALYNPKYGSAIDILSVFLLSVQIQGYIAQLFSIEINSKIFITIIILYN